MRQRGESQEAMLSRMADEREAQFAASHYMTVSQLRAFQKRCKHENIKKGHYVDSCVDCDKAMPI